MYHIPCIYMIENKINGKRYVGQTVDYAKRVNSHLSALRNGRSHCRHLQFAFDKYGEEAFVFSVLEQCAVDDLNEREQYWIEELNTNKTGYNMCAGGDGIRGFSFSIEQRQHISDALKGKTVSEVTRQHMSEHHADFSGSNNPNYGKKWADTVSPEKQKQVRLLCSERNAGKKNPNYGKKMSDEQKRKLSESRKAYYVCNGNPLKGRKRPEMSGQNSYRARAVVCVNTGIRYETIDEAEADTGIKQSTISSCCSGKLITAGKDKSGARLLWRYAEDYIPMSREQIEAFLKEAHDSFCEKISKGVVCITTGEVFGSMKDACEKYHIDPSSLSGHCRGKKSKNGCGRHPITNELLKWKYVE